MRPNTLAPVCAGETRASMRPATRLSHARGPSSTRPIQPGGCEQCHVNPRCIVSIGAPCRTYAPAARDTNCTGRIPRQFVSSVSCPSSIIQSCRPPVSHGLTSVVLGNARTHSTHEQKGAISLSEPRRRPRAGPGPYWHGTDTVTDVDQTITNGALIGVTVTAVILSEPLLESP